MSKNVQIVILFSAVAIIAVVLVKYFVYYDTDTRVSPSSESAQESSNAPSAPIVPAGLAKEAIDFYYSKASPEEKKKHDTLIESIAVAAPLLVISDCVPNPTVLKVGIEDSIIIKNNDTSTRTLARPLSLSLQVPPGSTKSFPVKDNLKKAGIYQYSCDGGPRIAGIFLVTEE